MSIASNRERREEEEMRDRKIGKLTVELDATKFSEQLAEVADAVKECTMRIQRASAGDETGRHDCMRGKCDCEPDRSSGVPFFGSLCEDNAAAVASATCDDLKVPVTFCPWCGKRLREKD